MKSVYKWLLNHICCKGKNQKVTLLFWWDIRCPLSLSQPVPHQEGSWVVVCPRRRCLKSCATSHLQHVEPFSGLQKERASVCVGAGRCWRDSGRAGPRYRQAPSSEVLSAQGGGSYRLHLLGRVWMLHLPRCSWGSHSGTWDAHQSPLHPPYDDPSRVLGPVSKNRQPRSSTFHDAVAPHLGSAVDCFSSLSPACPWWWRGGAATTGAWGGHLGRRLAFSFLGVLCFLCGV